METLLNLVWLLLALTSTTLWVVYWRHDLFVRGRRKQVLYSAVGLMCVLVLMFYAISLTDDLYEIAALVEDAALVSARSSKISNQQHRPIHPQPDLGVLASSPTSVPAIVPFWNVVVNEAVIVRPSIRGFLGFRGPPVQSLS